jgi:hypothetical protein
MVEVAIPSNMSHEILGFPATSPILSGSELDNNNTDITVERWEPLGLGLSLRRGGGLYHIAEGKRKNKKTTKYIR